MTIGYPLGTMITVAGLVALAVVAAKATTRQVPTPSDGLFNLVILLCAVLIIGALLSTL